MRKEAALTQRESIDPARVATIVREVIARLKSTFPEESNEVVTQERVITVSTIEQVKSTAKTIVIPDGSIVTPAARDEAKQLGITIRHRAEAPTPNSHAHANIDISDTSDPARAEAVRAQLVRRGMVSGSARIVLSETPARDVFELCAQQGEVAVMVASPTEVSRFANELVPTVWVLDMKRLNLIAAVNTATQVLRQGNASR